MRILHIEDNENLSLGLAELMFAKGHTVESAKDGNEALKIYRKKGPYDVVLTDQVHPGMSTTDLMTAIRERNPGQRIHIRIVLPMDVEPFLLKLAEARSFRCPSL